MIESEIEKKKTGNRDRGEDVFLSSSPRSKRMNESKLGESTSILTLGAIGRRAVSQKAGKTKGCHEGVVTGPVALESFERPGRRRERVGGTDIAANSPLQVHRSGFRVAGIFSNVVHGIAADVVLPAAFALLLTFGLLLEHSAEYVV